MRPSAYRRLAWPRDQVKPAKATATNAKGERAAYETKKKQLASAEAELSLAEAACVEAARRRDVVAKAVKSVVAANS